MVTAKETLAKFAVLRYIPDLEREEFINLGVVLHCARDRFLKFRTTTTLARLRTFDDELDIGFFKLILKGLVDEFENDLSGQERTDTDLLERITQYYVNQIQFSDVRYIATSNPEKSLDDLFNTYVYFEMPKPKRYDQQRVAQVLSKTFRKHKILQYLEPTPRVTGKYQDDIIFDYGYKSSDYVKSFSFEYDKQFLRALESARNWAFIFQEIKNQKSGQKPNFISFVHVDEKNTYAESALEILRSESEVFFVHEANRVAQYFQDKISHDDPQVRLRLP